MTTDTQTTIRLGSSVTVQGNYVKSLDNGRVVVRVGGTYYAGYPVAGPAPRQVSGQVSGNAVA